MILKEWKVLKELEKEFEKIKSIADETTRLNDKQLFAMRELKLPINTEHRLEEVAIHNHIVNELARRRTAQRNKWILLISVLAMLGTVITAVFVTLTYFATPEN